MAATTWKGYIAFGLVSIPVRLYAAARSERVELHQLHDKCHTRVRQQLFCPTCQRVIERSEIVKGYEVEKNTWVVLDEDEVKKIQPASSDTMEISQFVKLEDVDPIYFDSSFYAVPESPSRKAYRLLLETMEKSGYAAVAKVSMHQREYTVIIRPREHGLTLHTIFYPDEVRAVPEYGDVSDIELRPQEVELARKLVSSLAAPFDPSQFHDTYRERLRELIEAKAEGKVVRGESPKKLAPVIDLMQALEKSLAGSAGKKPAAKESAPAANAPPKRKRKAS